MRAEQKAESVCQHKVFSFKKDKKLCNKAAFDKVFQHRKKLIMQYFVVHYQYTAQAIPRLGMALAKKTIRLASVRNRIKRQIRESFRHAQLPPVDVIFVARTVVPAADNKTLAADLRGIWEKLSTISAG